MSGDLSPTALAELEIGSAQDHNARHERHTQMLHAAHEPAWLDRAYRHRRGLHCRDFLPRPSVGADLVQPFCEVSNEH